MLQYVIKCYTILWNVTNRYEVLKSLCYKRNGRFIKLSLEMNEDKTPSKMHRVLKLPKMSQYMNYMQLKVMNTI